MSEEFVALVCPKCGGKLNISSAKFEDLFVNCGKDTVMFIGSGLGQEFIHCEHCGTNFERKQKTTIANSKTVVDTGGGHYITGDVNTSGGDFVGRDDKITITQIYM